MVMGPAENETKLDPRGIDEITFENIQRVLHKYQGEKIIGASDEAVFQAEDWVEDHPNALYYEVTRKNAKELARGFSITKYGAMNIVKMGQRSIGLPDSRIISSIQSDRVVEVAKGYSELIYQPEREGLVSMRLLNSVGYYLSGAQECTAALDTEDRGDRDILLDRAWEHFVTSFEFQTERDMPFDFCNLSVEQKSQVINSVRDLYFKIISRIGDDSYPKGHWEVAAICWAIAYRNERISAERIINIFNIGPARRRQAAVILEAQRGREGASGESAAFSVAFPEITDDLVWGDYKDEFARPDRGGMEWTKDPYEYLCCYFESRDKRLRSLLHRLFVLGEPFLLPFDSPDETDELFWSSDRALYVGRGKNVRRIEGELFRRYRERVIECNYPHVQYFPPSDLVRDLIEEEVILQDLGVM